MRKAATVEVLAIFLALAGGCHAAFGLDDYGLDTMDDTQDTDDSDTGSTNADADVDSDADTGSDADSDWGTDTGTAISEGCLGGIMDEESMLCWRSSSSDPVDWWDAVSLCEEMDLGGHQDWRLPTRAEFVELLGGCDDGVLSGNSGYCDSCADETRCAEIMGDAQGWLWSSSEYDNNCDFAWRVRLDNGQVGNFTKAGENPLRCVREIP